MQDQIKQPKIYVAGHNGMVGSAIIRELNKQGFNKIVYSSRANLELTNQEQVRKFFEVERPDQVYLAAARVGGIYANNQFPAEFIYENLMAEANVIHQAWKAGVKKLLFLGSSCIYPKLAKQPIKEESLLTGVLEPTNEPYAISKIAGIKLCESYNRQYFDIYGTDYRSVMPTNLYGSGDNYHPLHSHVIPGLIRRFHDAKINKDSKVDIWGTGNPRREFLHVDDMAAACIYVMNLDLETYRSYTSSMNSHINVGSGEEVTIRDLAKIVCRVVGFTGKINFDKRMPDGTKRKLMDSSLINSLGWRPKISLQIGIDLAYKDFIENAHSLRMD